MTRVNETVDPLPRARAVDLSIVIVGTLVLTVLCCLLVDRPASTWTHGMFHEGGPAGWLLPDFIALTHLVDPLPPLAALGFLILGARLAGGGQGRLLATLFAASAATLVAITVKDQFKYAFGRLWPETWINPANRSWITDGAFGFTPFHGGAGWSSFPSGHMTVIAAPMVVLMLAWPVWRPLPALAILLVAVGLFGADYHFLGDMLAGTLLGSLCAAIVWRLTLAAQAANRLRPRA